jgi:hypothetical protein
MTLRVSFLVLSALVFAGCAPMPTGGDLPQDVARGSLNAYVLTYQTDGLGLPVGAHRIPGTSYVVLRQDYGSAPGGGLFGALGIFALHSSEQQKGKEAADRARAAFNFNLDAAAKASLARELGPTTLVDAPRRGTELLEIEPYVWIGTYKGGQSRIHVVLEARLKSKTGEPRWRNRYIYYSEETRSFAGDGGWMANDGAMIKAASQRGMDIAAAVLAQDVRGALPRAAKTAWYRAAYMDFPEPSAMEATFVSQDKGAVLVETRSGWGGVNIIPAKDISVVPK